MIDISTLQLLNELLTRHPPALGPLKVDFVEPVLVATIPIGRDHTATIYLHGDDAGQLVKLTGNGRP